MKWRVFPATQTRQRFPRVVPVARRAADGKCHAIRHLLDTLSPSVPGPSDKQLGSSGTNSHASIRGAGPPEPPSTWQPRSRVQAARLPESVAGSAARPPAPSYNLGVACRSSVRTEVAPASNCRRSSERNGC